MAVASEPAPEVEVRRSKRRRRTVSAYRDGEKIVVLVPASLTRKEEAEWVETMVARVQRSERTTPLSDAELMERALVLNDRYLGGLAMPGSVRWVQNQKQRWGSCTPGDRDHPALGAAAGDARLGHRLRARPRALAPDRAGPRRGVLGLGGPLPAGRAREGLPARLVGRRQGRPAARPRDDSTARRQTLAEPLERDTRPNADCRCSGGESGAAAGARRPATSGRRSTRR